MKIPSSANIWKVIATFEKLPPLVRRHHNFLNMGCTSVTDCSSPHCHAGWYAVACGKTPEKFTMGIFGGEDWSIRAAYILFPYQLGADLIKKDLDLNHEEFLYFVGNNEIWGNNNGLGIFQNTKAFEHPTKRIWGAQCLQHIVDHWKEVHARVVGMEQDAKKLNKPLVREHNDITKKLAVLPVEEVPDVISIPQ